MRVIAAVLLIGVSVVPGCSKPAESEWTQAQKDSAVADFRSRQGPNFKVDTVAAKADTVGLVQMKQLSTINRTECPQLVWVEDKGGYSIWRAVSPVSVTTSHIRNSRLIGYTTGVIRPPDTISMLIDNGVNADGLIRCVPTL